MAKKKEIVEKQKGLVEVVYLKDHGYNKEGSKGEMHISTAEALAIHKVVSYKGQPKPEEETE